MTTNHPLPPYVYSPITERDPITWPHGARVAVYVGLNVEHFVPGLPSTSIWKGTATLTPDALNHGWRDYGARVGIWCPLESDWAWLAHGRTNSSLHTGLTVEQETQVLAEITETISAATVGHHRGGWVRA